MLSGFKRVLLGRPRDVLDPGVFHKVSLAAFLAWVGLGADGLSSSAYGPEEAFKALGPHGYLAVAMAGAIALTVFIISYAYSRIIEHFPFGGGGYVVATRLLGRTAGVVSGSALIVDYVLTIAISIAAGVDAVFSFLPPAWQGWKLAVAAAAIGVLTLLNLRGVKESVAILAPVFLTFVVTHAILILGTMASRSHEIPSVLREIHVGFAQRLRLYGDRGRLQRPQHHAGAQSPDRKADHAVDGGLTRAHRQWDHARLSPGTRHAGSGAHHERRPGQPVRRRLPCRKLGRRGPVRPRHARVRSVPALRRGTGRLHRRPSGHGEHVDGLLAPTPLRPAVRPPDDAERRAAHERSGAARAVVHPRRGRPTRGDVLDQCISHLLAHRAFDVPLLGATTQAAARLA